MLKIGVKIKEIIGFGFESRHGVLSHGSLWFELFVWYFSSGG